VRTSRDHARLRGRTIAAENEFWIEAPEVVRLFPTFVWKSRLRPEVRRPINAAILNRLDEMRLGLPSLARGEAWQSGHGLHKQEELRGLVSCIDAAVDTALAFLRVGHPQVSITGCWANVDAPGAAHTMHAHPNNFLSGVYYVQAQEGADTINFHDPRAQTAIIRPAVAELTAYNTDQVVISISPGTLIVFPAWLPHSVDANHSELMRISISFNVMFAAFAQTMGQPLWGEQ
jgi:uncharacterized protein (TIGR02466 family)